MAIGLVIVQRIKLVSSKRTSVNHITRNPSSKRDRNILILQILAAVLINILLTVYALMHFNAALMHFRNVLAFFVALDAVLYIILLIRLSILKKAVGGAVSNLRRKSLLYVTMLFVGFSLEMVITFYTNSLVKQQLDIDCPLILNSTTMILMCIYYTKFIWEPVSYFLFNGQPRALFVKMFQETRQKMRYCNQEEESNNQAAVVPNRD